MHNARAKLEQATREMIARSAHEPGTFIIHEPPAGCMRGWKKVATGFVARDHHFSPACVRGSGQPFEMDYLMPGESFWIPLEQKSRPATGDNSD